MSPSHMALHCKLLLPCLGLASVNIPSLPGGCTMQCYHFYIPSRFNAAQHCIRFDSHSLLLFLSFVLFLPFAWASSVPAILQLPLRMLPLDISDRPIPIVLCFITFRLSVWPLFCNCFMFYLSSYLEFNALWRHAIFHISMFTLVLI